MKRVAMVIFLAISMIHVKAQVSYGAKLGLNIAKMGFSSNNYTTSSQVGVAGGIWGNYKLGDKTSIQAELLYSTEGTKEKLKATSTTGHINEGYLHIPVLFQYAITSDLYAEAGPQIGFLLSSKETFNSNKNDIKKYYKSTDLRIPVGVGYRLEKALPGFSVAARYSFSLSQINKEPVGGGKLKNNVFTIGVQYSLSQLMK